ncbi:MAG: ABC transporter permease subunit [Armatimonadetes bacterium]|nr:ABC transporter permease subunit [Armatimonadota bacterium]MBS1700429.1 ABC transporter permease subunit [Armatimonadota bacterium]MBS1725308.1 ABC transporter permease subunit [Armatimonadota bacterium]
MRPIIAIAKATVGEAIRRRVLLIILFVATILLFVAPLLGVLSARQEKTVLTGFVLGIVQLSSAVIAITLTVYMLPNEIERRTIYTILSKPVQRFQFLMGKYLGAVSALALMMGLMACVTILEFGVMQHDWAKGIELLQGIGMFFVQMSLLASVAMCLSTFVAPLVNFFLSGGIYLIGTLGYAFFDSFNKNPNAPAFSKGLAWFVSTILPNFASYNVQNKLINPETVIQNQFAYAVNAVVYGLFYIVIMLIAGMLIFDRREV